MMRRMMSRSLSCFLAVLVLSLSPLLAQRDADRKDWLQLFNGQEP